MERFGIDSGAIVAVAPVGELKAGVMILASGEHGFTLGGIEYDAWAKVFFVTDADGAPVPLDEAKITGASDGETNIIGEPIAYCPISKADQTMIEFSRFKFGD